MNFAFCAVSRRMCVAALCGVWVGHAFAKDLVVAADGSGDFRTVQAAIDAVPPNAETRTAIFIRKGTYPELVVVPSNKRKLTLRGEDRKQTIIAAENNAQLNPQHRELFSALADDFRLENLTLQNTTRKGGTQAEAMRVRADRVVLDHCDFKSFQDTLRLDGRIYVRECYIEGDVDFIWGGGTAYFDRCDIFAVHDGYLVQSRNGARQLGYVFVGCKIDTAPDLRRFVLARIDPGRFPHSHVAFVDCAMGPGVSAAGWTFDGPGSGASKETIRFWEFGSTDLAGRPIDASQREVVHVLGGADGWNPRG